MYFFLGPTEPSTQTTIGDDKVEFFDTVTFTLRGSKEMTVSAPIVNDTISFEDDENVDVNLTIVRPGFGVKFGANPVTRVVIVDDDTGKHRV